MSAWADKQLSTRLAQPFRDLAQDVIPVSVCSCAFHGSMGICYPWIEVISGQVNVSELGKGGWAGCVLRYQWKSDDVCRWG